MEGKKEEGRSWDYMERFEGKENPREVNVRKMLEKREGATEENF